jgi:programmed cell death protein 5
MSSSQPSQPNDEEIRRREAEAATMRQRVLQVVLDPQARQRLMNILLKITLSVRPLPAGSIAR